MRTADVSVPDADAVVRGRCLWSSWPMDIFESPELLELYHTYTARSGSVAAHFNAAAAGAAAGNPFVVALATSVDRACRSW
jgi:hypothetical protein